jgi:L-lactate dehydrogenase complex protein LldF
VAETGTVVMMTNEGNARMCTTLPPVHVAIMGMERVAATWSELDLMMSLLPRSGAGQSITSYVNCVTGPRRPGEIDGPEELHVIVVDNGRSKLLGTALQEALHCIRCGACLNVCPVYRQASGHAYRGVYSGPVGAVLSPLLAGDDFAALADLPKASSLCGACNEVCPVNIPIPDLLLRLRDRGQRTASASVGAPGGGHAPAGATPMTAWAEVASRPWAWKGALATGGLVNHLPQMLRPRPLRVWGQNHTLAPWRGGAFRKWLAQRSHQS